MKMVGFTFLLFAAVNLGAFDPEATPSFDELCAAHPDIELSADELSRCFFSEDKFLPKLSADIKAIFPKMYLPQVPREFSDCFELLKVALDCADRFVRTPNTDDKLLSRFGCLFDNDRHTLLTDVDFKPTNEDRKFLQLWLQCWIIELPKQADCSVVVDNLLKIFAAQESHPSALKMFRHNRCKTQKKSILSQNFEFKKYNIRPTKNNTVGALERNFKFIFITTEEKTYLFTWPIPPAHNDTLGKSDDISLIVP